MLSIHVFPIKLQQSTKRPELRKIISLIAKNIDKLLERVDLWCMNFVKILIFLITAMNYRPSGLSQNSSTKSRTIKVEPFGQRLFGIYSAFSPFHLEQLYAKDSGLV